MVGRYCRTSSMALTSILRGPKFRREEAATRERAQELLDYVGLGRSTELLARNMPYGDQRRLEIARALATDPQILLLDEPTAGMNPKETEETMHLIFKIRDSGLAVVVIEHDMRFIFNLCDRVLCLVRGGLLVEGTPGRGAVRPPGDRGLHRRRRRGGEARERHAGGQGPRGGLRQDQGRQGHQLRRQRGRGRHPDRHQRCRQDHDAAHHLGSAAPDVGGRSPSRARTSPRSPPTTSSSSGSRTPPRAGGSSPGSRVEENLLLGAFARKDKGDQHRPRRGVRAVPDPRGAARAAGRHVLRWRAADARDGPGDDEPAQAAHARRAVDGPVAADDEADHDDGDDAPAAGHDDPARRAERPGRAEAGDQGLRARGRQRSSCPAPAQELLASDDVRKAYLGED